MPISKNGRGSFSTGRVLSLLLALLLLWSASAATASETQGETGGHADPIAPVLLAFAIILGSAKLGGELFERMGQPAVLGELVAGVVLGNITLLNPAWSFFEPLRLETPTEEWAVVVDSFARLGVILLLFEVGLESTVGEMRRVGLSSLLVAVAGVVAPFILGYVSSLLLVREVPEALLAISPGFDITNIHLFVGATLTATSVGITARVLKDLGKMQLRESKIILGAAVIDDILGLLILSVVASLVIAAETGSGGPTFGSVAVIVLKSVGFLVVTLGAGYYLIPRLLRLLKDVRSGDIIVVASVLLCFLLAYLANVVGLAAIVGAFVAGLILEDMYFKGFKGERTLHGIIAPVTTLLVPVFFVVMGLRVHLEAFLDLRVLAIALAFTVAAILGKQVCALAVPEKGLHRMVIGLGMIPRGEVGLIFASIGMSLKVVDHALFSAIVIMVILTTFVTPPLLKAALQRIHA